MTKVKRQAVVEGDVARIPLTKGFWAKVDAVDVEHLCQFNWRAKVTASNVYALRTDASGRSVSMHRELLTPAWSLTVDHIDGDGLNNTRRNLRTATPSENACNKRCVLPNRSGYRGVDFHLHSGKWRARIRKGGKTFELGLFDSPLAAACAYAEAVPLVHLDFGAPVKLWTPADQLQREIDETEERLARLVAARAAAVAALTTVEPDA
jgi:hypothetical protein